VVADDSDKVALSMNVTATLTARDAVAMLTVAI